jgi:hypothetical protein
MLLATNCYLLTDAVRRPARQSAIYNLESRMGWLAASGSAMSLSFPEYGACSHPIDVLQARNGMSLAGRHIGSSAAAPTVDLCLELTRLFLTRR